MDKKQDFWETLRATPGALLTSIALVTGTAGLILAARQNQELYAALFSIAILAFSLTIFSYIALARAPSPFGGKGAFKYERYRVLAFIGIATIVGFTLGFLSLEDNREYLASAFAGTKTPTPISSPAYINDAPTPPQPKTSSQATDTPTQASVSLSPGSKVTLFSEDYNRTDSNNQIINAMDIGWTVGRGSWYVKNQVYECVTSITSVAWSEIGDNSWTDYIVTSDVQTDAEHQGLYDAGVIGRFQDSQHYYLAHLFKDSARIVKMDGGTWILLGSAPFVSQSGIWYSISLTFASQSIFMDINGTRVVTTEDEGWANGKIGLYCSSSAKFDNTTVSKSVDK